MRRALVIGIDDYGDPDNNLEGCVADAIGVAQALRTNGDGSPNFEVLRLISGEDEVTTAAIYEGLEKLFQNKAETVVLYFAGHGILDPMTNSGFLVSQNPSKGAFGLSLADVVEMANKAHPNIQSTVIILDSCHAGYLGEVKGLGNPSVSVIGTGVTVLAAADRSQSAAEYDGHGLFSGIVTDGLTGSASDILGRITPASLYALVDQTLGAFDQRPVYKANVDQFITLRQGPPKVAPAVLRKLRDYFPTSTHVYAVDPSYEPDRGEFTEEYANIPVDKEHVSIFREMQAYYRVSLVVPLSQPYPWHAAMHSTGFRLTALGAHYRRLALKERF